MIFKLASRYGMRSDQEHSDVSCGRGMTMTGSEWGIDYERESTCSSSESTYTESEIVRSCYGR